MGGAVVVFLSFQLHCTYTYMKQFPRQRPGASHHLHDASARNVNTLARPINPSCQLAIITETYTNAASSSQMQEKRHQNPRAVPDGGPTIGHVHSFSPPVPSFGLGGHLILILTYQYAEMFVEHLPLQDWIADFFYYSY